MYSLCMQFAMKGWVLFSKRIKLPYDYEGIFNYIVTTLNIYCCKHRQYVPGTFNNNLSFCFREVPSYEQPKFIRSSCSWLDNIAQMYLMFCMVQRKRLYRKYTTKVWDSLISCLNSKGKPWRQTSYLLFTKVKK